jgi:hypothetical protein
MKKKEKIPPYPNWPFPGDFLSPVVKISKKKKLPLPFKEALL